MSLEAELLTPALPAEQSRRPNSFYLVIIKDILGKSTQNELEYRESPHGAQLFQARRTERAVLGKAERRRSLTLQEELNGFRYASGRGRRKRFAERSTLDVALRRRSKAAGRASGLCGPRCGEVSKVELACVLWGYSVSSGPCVSGRQVLFIARPILLQRAYHFSRSLLFSRKSSSLDSFDKRRSSL